jgi:molybdate transport system substrate-binding protein
LLVSLATSTGAQTLKVLTAGAFKQVVVALVPSFEAGTGIKIELQNDTAGALTRRIQGGEAFDLVILAMPALGTLSSEAKVEPASVKPIARVGIGVAVKAGAPHPPLQTVEQFKDAVLKARKVAYIDPASGGSSGIYLDGLFQRLGIAEAVRSKAILVQGGLSAERVVSGEADLAIQQISELLPVAGASLVGPLPEDIQNYTTYGAAAAARSHMREGAALFLKALVTPEASDVIRSKGMLPAR